MAQRLLAGGEEVALLALIDAAAPGPAPAPGDADLAARFARDLGGLAGVDLRLAAADFEPLSEAGRADLLLARAAQAGVLPADFDAAGLAGLLEVFRRNFRARAAYAPRPYPGRLTLLPAAEPAGAEFRGAAAAWGRLAAAAAVLAVPGDHYSLVRPPHVAALAARLDACLAAFDAAERVPAEGAA
jgi:thioesterase domain-containing protein